MYKFDCDNTPNPAKFLESYRYLGYTNYSAIADLIDNSFDAEADNVWITVNTVNNGHFRVTISDDGCGMDEKTLGQAYRLGAMTERDPINDLGKYGVGSASASLSIARKTTVYTKAANSSCLTKMIDLDHMKKNNTFKVYLKPSTKAEEKLFVQICFGAKTGTAVILEECDNIQNNNVTQFKNTLRKHLGQVFRMFIDAGKRIHLNEESIDSVDPLLLSGITYGGERLATNIWSDEYYDLKIKQDGKERQENIRIRMAILPSIDRKLWKECWPRDVAKPSQRSQGFYVLRNNREISAADDLGEIFKRHNSLNRFRAEIFFPATLDDYFGVNFTKRKVNLNQSIFDQLEKPVGEQLETIKKTAERKETEKQEDVKESFKESEDIIQKRQKLLIVKKKSQEDIKKEIEEQRKKQRKKTAQEIAEEQKKVLDESGKPKQCHFELKPLGRGGVFFENDRVGHTLVITYNIDHPFYGRFYAERDKSTQKDLNFMLYSYCLAKRNLKPEQAAMVEQMEGLWSLNLKALLD